MSYRFNGKETVPEAVKRIALEQMDKALEQTKTRAGSLDDAVHETRVCFKKIRAVLRLVRFDLDQPVYKKENAYYRDANRKLSAVRDSAAMVETVDKLKERFVAQLAEGAFESVRKSLRQSQTKRQQEKKKALAEVAKTLVAARKRMEKNSLKHSGFSAIAAGLSQVYSQGRVGFENAYKDCSVEGFHEWRKQVKYLWYHVRLLRRLWVEPMKELADELKVLADYLSDDHDLAMLREKVLDRSKNSNNLTEREALVALIDQRRSELQSLARLLGERVYCEKPGAFKGRLHDYWRAWQSEQKIDPLAGQ